MSGRPVQIEDFDGGIVAFSYNAMGKPEVRKISPLTQRIGDSVQPSPFIIGISGLVPVSVHI